MVGIYRIKNVLTEDCYYGSSKNIEKRWRVHKNTLNKKNHMNVILQRAWDKYGENNFVFEIIEECDEKDLFFVEQKYLDLKPKYNIGVKSSGGDNLTQNPNKESIINNIKISSKKWRESLTPEQRKERFSKPMDKNPNWKGGTSFIYCDCGKRIGYGRIHCNKCRPRNKENNPFFGKTHSDEFKKILSEKMKGNTPNNRKEILIDGVYYESYNHASVELKIPVPTIRWRILSKNPKYKNYHFKNENKTYYSDEEQRERISKPQIGKQTNFNKPFTINGVEYRTLKTASDSLGIHQQTIKGRLKSKNFENYKYKN